MSAQVAADLRAAWALIDTPRKWCKGEYHGVGSHCAYGAIALVSERDDEMAVLKAFRRVIGDIDVESWNDTPERTHDDVKAAFDAAIAAEEAAP